MANRFPKTVAACRRTDSNLWEIGDALLDEVGPPPSAGVKNGSYASITEVIEELEEAGLDTVVYSVSYLSNLRNTAFNFPSGKRRARLPFSIHRIAKTPEALEEIVARHVTGKITKITARKVEQYLQHQRQQLDREHEKEMERLREKKEEARKELKAAEEKKRRARSQKDREEAMKEVKAARDRAKSIPDVMPKPDYSKVEPLTEQSMLVVDLEFMAKADHAIQLGEEVLETVQQHAHKFDTVTVNSCVEQALTASNIWRKVADAARKFKVNKRGHLAAI